jgi:enamine deaminase RidA (YjgF/YER057c/UK114 family)
MIKRLGAGKRLGMATVHHGLVCLAGASPARAYVEARLANPSIRVEIAVIAAIL